MAVAQQKHQLLHDVGGLDRDEAMAAGPDRWVDAQQWKRGAAMFRERRAMGASAGVTHEAFEPPCADPDADWCGRGAV